ncbi:MAG TPA: orotidine-5'-phosphate decarboxylase [Bacteroidia bacterium]|jgi:orotidine-5'-phosphate decarboxylase|nr:orotidine-5'-phosphate decarboxylase [Bacteroidia bacterium]
MKRFLTRTQISTFIHQKKTFLCVGLDTDINKLPSHFPKTPASVVEFNESIIEETHDICVSYKLNLAFYEAMGAAGWDVLRRTIELLPENSFVIADAKRGDIGNTAAMYAEAFFKDLDVDAVTLSPYMGKDSIAPFLDYKGKWSILLGLTSNEGSKDFQMQKLQDGSYVYEQVLKTSCQWGTADNTMYVIGATQASSLSNIRKILPEHFFLVPGVGAQAGDMAEVIKNGATDEGGLLINASRSILYASSGKDFAAKAREEAMKLKKQMEIGF